MSGTWNLWWAFNRTQFRAVAVQRPWAEAKELCQRFPCGGFLQCWWLLYEMSDEKTESLVHTLFIQGCPLFKVFYLPQEPTDETLFNNMFFYMHRLPDISSNDWLAHTISWLAAASCKATILVIGGWWRMKPDLWWLLKAVYFIELFIPFNVLFRLKRPLRAALPMLMRLGTFVVLDKMSVWH